MGRARRDGAGDAALTTAPVVREAVAAYHRALEADPAAAAAQADDLSQAFREGGITFGGEPMRTFLRPHFVSRAEWNALRRLGTRVLDVATRAARHAFAGDVHRLMEFLGTPAAEARWVAVDPGPPDVVLSRLDAFLGPQGPQFVEINSDAPAGFGYGDRMAAAFRKLPALQELAAAFHVSYQRSIPALADALKAAFRDGGGTGAPAVAIVDWSDVKTRADQEILCAELQAHGMTCALGDPRDARLHGGRLFFGDAAADVVYRRAVLSELVDREAEVDTFLRAYQQGAAVFVNSLRCRLGEDKAFFAVLTDEAFAPLFEPEERALLARTIPWTRRVAERRTTAAAGTEVDLVPYVLAERERLVLKPAHGYGGREVWIGDETAPSDWEAAVRAALDGAWVVQARVEIPEEPFPVVEEGALRFEPMKVNVNPFHAAGAEVGAVTRASRSAVINVSAGGGSVPTFVVE